MKFGGRHPKRVGDGTHGSNRCRVTAALDTLNREKRQPGAIRKKRLGQFSCAPNHHDIRREALRCRDRSSVRRGQRSVATTRFNDRSSAFRSANDQLGPRQEFGRPHAKPMGDAHERAQSQVRAIGLDTPEMAWVDLHAFRGVVERKLLGLALKAKRLPDREAFSRRRVGHAQFNVGGELANHAMNEVDNQNDDKMFDATQPLIFLA